jgi:hypothetical protein
MYARVCAEAGARLAALLTALERRDAVPQAGPRTPPYPIPDSRFNALLRRSRRRLMLV